MEEKRTIWIVAAVGIFLAVVLLSARIISRGPSSSKNIIARYTQPSKGQEKTTSRGASSGWTKTNTSDDIDSDNIDNDDIDSLDGTVGRVDDMTVIAKNATVFALQRDESAVSSNAHDADVAKAGAVTSEKIDLNKLLPSEVATIKALKEDVESDSVMASAVHSSASNGEGGKVSAPVVKINVAPAPVVKKVVMQKTVAANKAETKKAEAKVQGADTTWWVQAASFTSLKYADNARETLGSNKINADVFTYKDSFGKVFYRVRVGPYLTKSEAEYWKSRIGQIESFASTQSFVVRG